MIIRVCHDRDNPYFLLNRAASEDDRISFKAVGIHTYLMSKPDDWTVQETDLAQRHTDGAASVRSGLKELKEAGYVEVVSIRDEGGRITGWETHVYEVAKIHNVENPHSGLSTSWKTADIVSNDSLVSKELLVSNDDDRASPQKSSGGDRDGRWLLQALRDTGLFAYMDSDAMRLAAALEEDYTDDQLIVGKGKLVEAHKKQIGEGKRGITAPLAYLRAILMRGLDESGSAGKGNGRGRPAEIDWDAEMERYLREHPIDSEPIDPDEITF